MENLFRKYLNNQCTPREVKELLQYFSASENETALRDLIGGTLEVADAETEVGLSEKVFEEIRKQIDEEKAKFVPLFKRTGFRVAAAAVLLIGVIIGYSLLNRNDSENDKKETAKTNVAKPDIAPGGDKAILTLADGSQIILDNAVNGDLAAQGNVKLVKLDGQIAYNSVGSPLKDGEEVLFNTISTPRGGQYQLVLADGSKVWLNAASSLRFPASFVGNERRVELTGEGYFEVAKYSGMPFKVSVAGKEEVEVLGTHFNINAYSNEATIKTTLLEGSVKVSVTGSGLAANDSRLLSSGQQSQLTTNGQFIVERQVDLNEVIAWKNGKFDFKELDIQTTMRQIERWYDVEVSYRGAITDEEFIGVISRNVNISQILEMLEKTGAVKFEIEGKRIIVK